MNFFIRSLCWRPTTQWHWLPPWLVLVEELVVLAKLVFLANLVELVELVELEELEARNTASIVTSLATHRRLAGSFIPNSSSSGSKTNGFRRRSQL